MPIKPRFKRISRRRTAAFVGRAVVAAAGRVRRLLVAVDLVQAQVLAAAPVPGVADRLEGRGRRAD